MRIPATPISPYANDWGSNLQFAGSPPRGLKLNRIQNLLRWLLLSCVGWGGRGSSCAWTHPCCTRACTPWIEVESDPESYDVVSLFLSWSGGTGILLCQDPPSFRACVHSPPHIEPEAPDLTSTILVWAPLGSVKNGGTCAISYTPTHFLKQMQGAS